MICLAKQILTFSPKVNYFKENAILGRLNWTRYKTRYLCVVQCVVIQCREVADLCGDPDLDIVALGVADLVGKTDIKAFLYKISS